MFEVHSAILLDSFFRSQILFDGVFQIANRGIGDSWMELSRSLLELLFGVELFDGRTDGETPHGGGEFF